MEYKKEISKTINALSGSKSPYDIFCDWIAVMALSLANAPCLIHSKVWHEREKQYMNIVQKYSKEELNRFVYMFYLLTGAFEERLTDWLGEIYMESGCGNKNTGQFFTPFNVSQMCAMSTIPDDYDGSYPLTVNEPSTGGGGMIIAMAAALKDKGYNYQACMKIIAQDLDWKGVYMTYTQLSLIGVDAIVVQGDTLLEPYTDNYPRSRVFRTLRNMGGLI
jgi:type I restriction-modification system DNA methylase subunit